MDEPYFTWLGTAGFRIDFAGMVILVDPYLSRNQRARPVLRVSPRDLADADFIFLTHGHFDHLADVPEIMSRSDAWVYCSEVSARTLEGKGVSRSRINTLQGGDSLQMDGFSVGVETTRHIMVDWRLILRTAPGVLKEVREILPQVRGMPAGPVLVFNFRFGELRTTQLGSLGLKPEGLGGKSIPTPDILFLPLQGHTDICRMAAELAAALGPRAVVPEHHDDFFPPVSRMVEIEPFRLILKKLLPECAYYEPQMGVRFSAGQVLAGPNE